MRLIYSTFINIKKSKNFYAVFTRESQMQFRNSKMSCTWPKKYMIFKYKKKDFFFLRLLSFIKFHNMILRGEKNLGRHNSASNYSAFRKNCPVRDFVPYVTHDYDQFN